MVCVRLRYTPRERSTERAFIPSLLFFFSFLSAHLVALSYSSRPVHARARVVVVVVVLCGVREVLFSDYLCGALARVFLCFLRRRRGRGRGVEGFLEDFEPIWGLKTISSIPFYDDPCLFIVLIIALLA